MKLIRIYKRYWIGLFPKKFWFHTWKPAWHNRKIRYISIGLWIVSFFAGDPIGEGDPIIAFIKEEK